MSKGGSKPIGRRVSGVERTLRVLLKSDNRAAGDLLRIAIHSEDSALRLGAVRALARRHDAEGHVALVDAWSRLREDARSALGESDARTRFRHSLERLVKAPDPARRLNASRAALACNATETLAGIVAAAVKPDDPNGPELAQIALRLAEGLRTQIDRRAEGRLDGGHDPAFSRRAAVNELGSALAGFDQHRRNDLVEAMLMLAPSNEPSLNRALNNTQHVAHEEIVGTLEGSTSPGVMELLAGVLKDLAAPDRLLKIAAARSDAPSLSRLMHYLGYPIGARATENAARIDRVAWVEPEAREALLRLRGPQQASAIQFAAASGVSRRRLAELIVMVLNRGADEGRLEACRAIDRLPTHLAREPLETAVRDASSRVAATATRLLRKKRLPGAKAKLVNLLDHDEHEVRGAAQESLPEISYSNYRDGFAEMSAEQRSTAGVLVAKADADVTESLAAEIRSGAPERRLRALHMVEEMGIVEQMTEPILTRADDPDTGVRAEVAHLLARAELSEEVVQALRQALSDPSPAVRSAASASLASHGLIAEEDRA